MKVASIQLKVSDDNDKQGRLERAKALIDQVGSADLILLPEIWNVGFFAFDRYEEQSEPLDGPTISAISDKAAQNGSYILAGSIVERTSEGLFNTAVLLDRKGNITATYRKIHLFGYNSAESKLLMPGREVAAVETELGVFGLSTCYDLRFPELYRRLVDKGAQAFLVVSAWPYPRLEHWNALNRVRAFENQCFLISSNCCGVSLGKQYCGHSSIVDPWGIPVASAGDYETVLQTEVDVRMVQETRDEFPALRDRVLEL
ncbi:MAG: carbon-nitrogen family hydrolase [Chloroflexi bacterium]|nr:carbon-nitrogen family hydrolase [Chloroflexota bacterium]